MQNRNPHGGRGGTRRGAREGVRTGVRKGARKGVRSGRGPGAALALLAAVATVPLSGGAALAGPAPGPADAPASAVASAPQRPASLYAPSALTLTIARGTSAAAPPLRAVTLSCRPGPAGTHPAPTAACSQLAAAKGDFDDLPGHGRGMCTTVHDPMTVTAEGVWDGSRVRYERTFPNACVMRSEGRSVFAF